LASQVEEEAIVSREPSVRVAAQEEQLTACLPPDVPTPHKAITKGAQPGEHQIHQVRILKESRVEYTVEAEDPSAAVELARQITETPEEEDTMGCQVRATRDAHHKDVATRGNVTRVSIWREGPFFLLMVAVVGLVVGLIARCSSLWTLPIALVTCLLLVVVVGVLILKTLGSDWLSEKSFVILMLESLKRLPLLRHFVPRTDSDRKTNESPDEKKS
jgi:hypothetical protein